ncbi:hypothetical protein EMIT0194P_200059 [Pseudomonas serbica]
MSRSSNHCSDGRCSRSASSTTRNPSPLPRWPPAADPPHAAGLAIAQVQPFGIEHDPESFPLCRAGRRQPTRRTRQGSPSPR